MDFKFRVGKVGVWSVDGAIVFAAGMAIDADGSPFAYHPPTLEHPRTGHPPGLDYLTNAYETRTDGSIRWFGVVTDGGGLPIVQGPEDPCPGFYVSATSLQDATKMLSDPARYVDSNSVPFVSLPPQFKRVAALGDVAATIHHGKAVGAIWADVGPPTKIGEASIACAAAHALYHGNVNDGHDPLDVVYVLFPGTATTPPWPRAPDDIAAASAARLASWGGVERARELFPDII